MQKAVISWETGKRAIDCPGQEAISLGLSEKGALLDSSAFCPTPKVSRGKHPEEVNELNTIHNLDLDGIKFAGNWVRIDVFRAGLYAERAQCDEPCPSSQPWKCR